MDNDKLDIKIICPLCHKEMKREYFWAYRRNDSSSITYYCDCKKPKAKGGK